MNGRHLAGAAILTAVLATGSALVGFDGTTWLAILGLLLGPQLLGHTIFNQVLNQVPATTVAVVVLSEPIAQGCWRSCCSARSHHRCWRSADR